MITHFNTAKNGAMLFLSERPFNIHLHYCAHHSTTLDNVHFTDAKYFVTVLKTRKSKEKKSKRKKSTQVCSDTDVSVLKFFPFFLNFLQHNINQLCEFERQTDLVLKMSL
jgi:hypothetical protein